MGPAQLGSFSMRKIREDRATERMQFWVIALSPCFVLMASAQTPAVPGSGPVLQMSPISGVPLTGEQVEERTHFAAEGSPNTTIMRSKIYRDGEGRIRIDWNLEGAEGRSFPIVYLLDPVASSTAILLVPYKVAHRTSLRGSAGFQIGLPAIGEPLPDIKWQTHSEELGERTIEGFEATGGRITRISEDQPPLRASDEAWTSKEAGLRLRAEASGPGWKHTVKIQNIRRGEPDPGLFVIPPDYTIQDSPR
jgi:hypothetical protein